MPTTKNQLTDLLSTDSSRAVADMAAMAVGNDQAAFDVVFDLCINKPYPVNMRAARVLTLSSEKHPELIHPYLGKITGLVVSKTTGGVKRGLMKIIIDSIDINDIPDSGLLIDHCFKLILDSEQEYALRVYAMEIVFKTCKIVPDLKYELRQTLEMIEEDSPPSIRARAGMILKKLGK